MRLHEHLRTRLQLVTRAFGSRDYRIYFAGLAISMTGSWMQSIAMGWLVYRLTGSGKMLGTNIFLSQIPSLVLGPIAGVLLDRIDKRRLIIATQTLAAVQALALAALVYTGTVQVWHILWLSFFFGCVNAFDVPARQSFVIHVVGNRDHLGNAIALNSVIFNSARLIGPSLAGLAIAAFKTESVCFLANAISYVAAIVALLLLRTQEPVVVNARHNFLGELKEGITFAFGFKPVRALLLLTAWTSLVTMPYGTLTPIFAREVLHGDARTMGFLHSSVAAGALCGALYLASRVSVKGLGVLVAFASMLCGIGLTGFSFSTQMALSMPLMAVTGLGILSQMASTNTLIQTLTDDDKRGRVMSLYSTAMFGIVPCGCYVTGWLADKIGAPRTQMVAGILTIAASLVYATRIPALRTALAPLYHRLKLSFRPGPPPMGQN